MIRVSLQTDEQTARGAASADFCRRCRGGGNSGKPNTKKNFVSYSLLYGKTLCVPGPLDPAASRLGGSWRGGTVGQQLFFTLTMTDGYNNTVIPT